MFVNRRTSKICNVCREEVAFKDIFRFRTVKNYIALKIDYEYPLHHTNPGEVHICKRCWDRMQNVVRAELEYAERIDNERKN